MPALVVVEIKFIAARRPAEIQAPPSGVKLFVKQIIGDRAVLYRDVDQHGLHAAAARRRA
jgi:hypothetical protein